MNLVRVISNKIQKARRILKVLRLGGSDVQTGWAIQPHGVDSAPVEGKEMIALYAKTGKRGEQVIVGYINENAVAKPGELRLYSLKDGSEKTFMYFKSDGTIEVNGNSDNFVTFSDMKAAFDQLKSELNAHTHTGNLGIPTGPATPPATADMSQAKSKNIKTE